MRAMSDVLPFKRPTKPQDLVLRFLNSVGHKRDAEFYVDLFTSTKPESFAIIVVDEEVLREEIDAVLFEIRYLMRLSLYPVVLIRSTNDFLEKIDIENYFKRAKIALNFLSDEYNNVEKLEFIKERIRKKTLPLMLLDPELDMVSEIVKLANILRTGKLLFLKRQGGVINQFDQDIMSIINLRFDLTRLLDEKIISESDVVFLSQCNDIIARCDHKVFVSVVSPNSLLRELFTVKGAGTLIQFGSKITTFNNWDNIDPRSLKRLLEMSFEKTVRDDFFTEPMDYFYIEENYMGAAMLKKHGELTYLSKFAVGTEARGLGIGRDIWNELIKNHQKIFWRSDPDKFITHWYVKQCDGMHKTKDWTVFWKGLDVNEITESVAFALGQKIDFA